MKKKYLLFSLPLLLLPLLMLYFWLKPSVSSLMSCYSRPTEIKDFNQKQICLESKVKTLFRPYTEQEIIDYFISSSASEEMKLNCHSIAHEVGRQSYKKENNLEKTLYKCPASCGSGCKHGALEEAFKSDLGVLEIDNISDFPEIKVIEIGDKYCNNEARTLCHAVGHIFFKYKNNLNSALFLCEATKYNEKCYQGVFMEYFGGVNALHSKPYLKVDRDYTFICGKILPKYRHSCYFVAVKTDVEVFDINNKKLSPDDLVSKCRSLANKEEQSYCIESLASMGDSFIKNCEEFDSSEERNSCTLGKNWLNFN